MKNVVLAFLAVAILLGFLLYGSSGLTTSIVPDLMVAWGPEPKSFDPAIISGVLESRFVTSFFEGLIIVGKDNMSPAPGIAQSWEKLDNGFRYIFHLRKSKWSDGMQLTARDFEYSWRRVLEPATGCDYTVMPFFIKNAEKFYNEKVKWEDVGVKVLDDYTLEVTLENPIPFFLDVAGFMTLLPVKKECVEKYKRDWIRPENMVCNGPYIMKKWQPNYCVVMEKNPYYWDAENVKVNRIVVYAYKSMYTAFNCYGKGIDWLDGALIPPEYSEIVKTHLDHEGYPEFAASFLRFNVTKPPFDKLNVRKAFAMAIKKDDLTTYIMKGGETPTDSIVPDGVAGYRKAEGLHYNPQKAKELFKSEYPDLKTFPRVELLMPDSITSGIFEHLQEQWREVLGVKVDSKKQEWKVYLDSMTKIEFNIGYGGWVGDYYDPNTFLDMWITNGDSNETGWGKKEYDEMIVKAARESDPTKRFQILLNCEKEVLEEETIIVPLYQRVGHILRKRWIKGLTTNPMTRFLIKNIWIEK